MDVWVLVPTGLGVNRLLKNNGQISDAWLERLEKFLGLSRDIIEKHFYKKQENLFGEITKIKVQDAIDKSASCIIVDLRAFLNSFQMHMN